MSGGPVLVVVDVQNGFVTENSKSVVPVIASLVALWQAHGGDTIFTRYHNYPNSPYERLIQWTALQSAPETDIVDELKPLASRATAVVDKDIYTLFSDDGAMLVHEHGWTDLYICGIDTNSCVLKTAVDAFERNLTPWILADACASHSGPDVHAAGLLVAAKFIGPRQIIETSAVQLPPSAATHGQ